MPKLTKLQIGLISGAVAFFVVLPISLCAFLFSQLKPQKTNSYNQTPDLNWSRLFARAFDQKHSKRLLKAHLLLSNATTHMEEHKYKEARAEFDSAAAIYEDELGPDNMMVCTTLSMAGQAETAAENYEEAEKLYQRIVDITKKQPFSRYAAVAMLNLAKAKYENEDFEGAVKVLEKSLALQEKSVGKDNFDLIDTICLLGEYNEENENSESAELNYKRCLQLARKQQSKPWERDILAKIGSLYFTNREFKKSISIFEELLRSSTQRDDWSAYALERLCGNYLETEDFAKLKDCASKALKLREHESKKNSASMLYDYFSLSVACLMLGEAKEFEDNFNQYAKVMTAAKKQEDIGSDQIGYCRYLVHFGKLQEAEKMLNCIIEFDKKQDLSTIMNRTTSQRHIRSYAQLLCYAGRYKESKEYLSKAAASSKKEYAASEKKVLANYAFRDYLTDLIALELTTGDLKAAREKYKELKASGNDLLGPVVISAPFAEVLESRASDASKTMELKNVSADTFGIFRPTTVLKQMLQ